MKDKNNDSSKQLVLTVVGIAILVLVIVGIVLAVLFYTKDGDKNKDVSTATITMNYTENTNGISITNATPMNDTVGKLLTNEENVFDFTVNAKLDKGTKVNYEIVAVKDSNSTLLDNNVKLYLQKSDDSSYSSATQVIEPSNYVISDATPIGKVEGMVLDKGTFTKSSTIYYRLKLWTSDTYNQLGTNGYYKIKVNIYGKAQ